MKTEQELQDQGFTVSGIKRYQNAAREFCDQLFQRSIVLGDQDKSPEAAREVTHDHVRQATETLSRRRRHVGVWERTGHIAEYLFAILAGVGGGKLDQSWGIALCVSSAAIGVILISVRISKQD